MTQPVLRIHSTGGPKTTSRPQNSEEQLARPEQANNQYKQRQCYDELSAILDRTLSTVFPGNSYT